MVAVEGMVINYSSKYLTMDSNANLYKTHTEHPYCDIVQSEYRKRGRKLFLYLEKTSVNRSFFLKIYQDHFGIDSTPFAYWKLTKCRQNKFYHIATYGVPNKDYGTVQSAMYYPYTPHTNGTVGAIFKRLALSPTSPQGLQYCKDKKTPQKNYTQSGDWDYPSGKHLLNPFQTTSTKLNTPPTNKKKYRKHPYIDPKPQKKIETLFSRWCTLFIIKNYTKYVEGLKTRLVSKIATRVIVQFSHKVVFN